jgi:hypothetical protein
MVTKTRSEGDKTPHVDRLDTQRVKKEWRALLGPSTCSCIETSSLPTGRAHQDRDREVSGS